MSVFLRWGVFGILAVAGLLYAYNASKELANRRPPPAVAAAPAPDGAAPAPHSATTPDIAVPASCEAEVVVARLAIEARDAREPIDRLLRAREIAFEADEKRRERLTQVAKRWFAHPDAIGPFSVSRMAAAECADAAAVTKP